MALKTQKFIASFIQAFHISLCCAHPIRFALSYLISVKSAFKLSKSRCYKASHYAVSFIPLFPHVNLTYISDKILFLNSLILSLL